MAFETEPSSNAEPVVPEDPGSTISEIPSRRLPSTFKTTHSELDERPLVEDGPREPPDTVDVVHRDGAPPHVQGGFQESSGAWVEYADQASGEALLDDAASGEFRTGRNLRESASYAHYTSTPSYASFEIDASDSAAPERIPSQKGRIPPKTVVADHVSPVGVRATPNPDAVSRPSAKTPPTSSSAPPRRRRRWLLFFFVGLLALAVGAGGLVLGFHLWETFQGFQGQ
jgi:hypothetical protein